MIAKQFFISSYTTDLTVLEYASDVVLKAHDYASASCQLFGISLACLGLRKNCHCRASASISLLRSRLSVHTVL